MKPKLYMVLHSHKHGISSGLVFSDHRPSPEEVAKAMNWDFQQELDEFIEIMHYPADTKIPFIHKWTSKVDTLKLKVVGWR